MGSQHEPKRRARASLVGVGTATLLLIGGLSWWALSGDDEPEPAEVQEQFLQAWAAHRQGSYVMEAEWSRQDRSSEAELRSAVLHVQDPPDRVIRQFGSARGQMGGQVVRCDTDVEDSYRCSAENRPAPDYEEQVDSELEILASYFEEPMPLYAVEMADDGCFELTQVGPWPDAPYGTAAKMCFDSSTGALSYIQRELPEVVEVTEATSITSAVSAADFDLSEDERFRTKGDLGEPPDLPG